MVNHPSTLPYQGNDPAPHLQSVLMPGISEYTVILEEKKQTICLNALVACLGRQTTHTLRMEISSRLRVGAVAHLREPCDMCCQCAAVKVSQTEFGEAIHVHMVISSGVLL
eukprot:scaffold322726_cov18-Tisochrysis_lutea.AAC.2